MGKKQIEWGRNKAEGRERAEKGRDSSGERRDISRGEIKGEETDRVGEG